MGNDEVQKLRIGILGGGVNSAVGNVHRTALRIAGGTEIIGGVFSRNIEVNQNISQMVGISKKICICNFERNDGIGE
jgi:hypothetical protein